MSLPKWIHDAFGRSFECSDGEKLEEALTIAVEALQAIDKHQAIVASSMSKYSTTRHLAEEALRRIEALGK